MSQSSYKLVYFDAKGRAEVVRLVFAAAGVEYEDQRLNRDEFKAAKDAGEFTYGQVVRACFSFGYSKLRGLCINKIDQPVLVVDGKTMPQSNAIARFLARKFDLLGADEFESAMVDAATEQISDFMQKVMQAFFAKEDKETKLKEAMTVHLPNYFGALEKQAAATGTGFLVGGKLSLADIALSFAWDYIKDQVPEDAKAAIPTVLKVIDNTNANPGIKAWLEKRPKNAF